MAVVLALREGEGVKRGGTFTLAVLVAGLVTTGILTSSALARSRSAPKSLPTLNQQIFAAINTFRTSHGLAALRRSRALERSALAHSSEMGARSYFAHNSANGEQFYVRVERYYRPTGYSHWTVGENLVWGAPTLSAAAAMQRWIKSPPHLENLETAKWRDLGVSAVTVSRGGGVYGGQRVTIITTDFGVRTR
jgi:uncharacterized protein YkwD